MGEEGTGPVPKPRPSLLGVGCCPTLYLVGCGINFVSLVACFKRDIHMSFCSKIQNILPVGMHSDSRKPSSILSLKTCN